MDLDDLIPKRAGDPLAELVRQDLDRFSVDELRDRIAALEVEVGRCRAKLDFAASHRSSAESLFKR